MGDGICRIPAKFLYGNPINLTKNTIIILSKKLMQNCADI